jgi:glycosyltransferase involved in cell wall biosynthesis
LGSPVLLTDRCGFEEVEAVGGGLVVPADAAGLAQGLASMLDRTRNLRLMGQRLRSFVLAQYDWPTVAGRLHGHLAELAGAPKLARHPSGGQIQ